MSIWTQLHQLIRRFFPNRVSQFFLYFALAIVMIASPTREKLVYVGIETLPGYYFYVAAGVSLLLAIVFAHLLPKRHFRSVSAVVIYWVDRRGGLDYAAYYNDLARFGQGEHPPEPSAERLHHEQFKARSEKLAMQAADESAMTENCRQFAALIHQQVQDMDSKLFGRSLLGKNEKIIFDTVMGAIYYWRLSDREVIVGMTTDQHSVDNRTADDDFTSLGEAILELTGRRRKF